MKRWIGLALILVPILAPAASFWDGTAALQRGDAAFESGMFAASNSFAPDTQLLVQNVDTGRTATVTITKRIEGQSDILVLLSPTAASTLGISAGALVNVRVTLAPRSSASGLPAPVSVPASQDPDLNPAVAYGGPESAAATTPPVAAARQPVPTVSSMPSVSSVPPVPSVESLPPLAAPARQPTLAPASTLEAPAPPQQGPVESATAQAAATTPVPAAGPSPDDARKAAEDAAILADAASRSPQKQVFLPPREDTTFAYVPPTPQSKQPTVEAPASTKVPERPTITAVIGEPGAPPAGQPDETPALAEAAAPQESVPREIVGAEAVQPGEAAVGAEVALAEAAAPEQSVPREIVGAEALPPAEAASGAEVALAEAAAPEQSVPREIVGAEALPPAETVAGAAVALAAPEAPTSENPAAVEPVQTTQAATTQQTVVAQQTAPSTGLVSALPQKPPVEPPRRPKGDTWFVQLAAYATEKGARELASTLSTTYPALVVPPATTGSHMFRVVLGPLNKAESGTLLVWFRFRGFPDAFVKQE